MSKGRYPPSWLDPHAGYSLPLAAEIPPEADRIIVTTDGRLDLGSPTTSALTPASALAARRDEAVIGLEGLDSPDRGPLRAVVERNLRQARGLIIRVA
jgi:hypothetical protein